MEAGHYTRRMSRISGTITIAKSSWRMLKADKELLLLPLLSIVAAVVVAATFLWPLLFRGGEGDPGLGAGDYVLFLVLYFVLSYIPIFFNVALVSAAHERLSGGDPTVRSALRGALGLAFRILPWALVAASISAILRALEERANILGKIVISLLGAAWSVITFLVLPIMVVERIGVRDAFRRSIQLFRGTWGENITAHVGFSLLGFVAALPGIASVGFAFAGEGGLPFLLLGSIWLLAVTVVFATLSGIFQTVLYHYAVDGVVPSGYFQEEVLGHAFQPRRKLNRRIIGF